MKNLIAIIALVVGTLTMSNAQDMMHKDSAMINLTQVPGEFTKKEIKVQPGTYTFNITNDGVSHDVGFVLVKKGMDVSNPENHIKTAYVKEMVKNGTSQHSQPTKLVKGEYVYFCPLNPTSTDNTIIVE